MFDSVAWTTYLGDWILAVMCYYGQLLAVIMPFHGDS
jgi:hypothetical protein